MTKIYWNASSKTYRSWRPWAIPISSPLKDPRKNIKGDNFTQSYNTYYLVGILQMENEDDNAPLKVYANQMDSPVMKLDGSVR